MRFKKRPNPDSSTIPTPAGIVLVGSSGRMSLGGKVIQPVKATRLPSGVRPPIWEIRPGKRTLMSPRTTLDLESVVVANSALMASSVRLGG